MGRGLYDIEECSPGKIHMNDDAQSSAQAPPQKGAFPVASSYSESERITQSDLLTLGWMYGMRPFSVYDRHQRRPPSRFICLLDRNY